MKKHTFMAIPVALAAVLLSGCTSTPTVQLRTEPTYQDAANNAFLQSSRDAIAKLAAGFDISTLGGGPVLVATVVNVNDLGRSAPLGRTLSEQYSTQMAANGFHVKEIKLRGDVFVKEGAGELLLSREIKDIARSHNASMVLVGTYSTLFLAAPLYAWMRQSETIVRKDDKKKTAVAARATTGAVR